MSDADGLSVQHLTPEPLNRPPFREDALQTLLAEHPEILPLDEIEAAFAPAVCLGREIACLSGFLDVLYVSPLGYLTLVEAKLWDNPEARREVIGQILDYAKDFAAWRFDDLDAAVRKASGRGIVETVRAAGHDVDAAAFADAVSRHLRLGRMLLLVVGNGIREGAERLGEFVQASPALRFGLALVELALYRLPDGSLLVLPRTLARTVEIVRAVVEVRDAASVVVEAPPPTAPLGAASARRSITEDLFYDELAANTSAAIAERVRGLVDRLVEVTGAAPSWGRGSGGVTLHLPDPRGGGDRIALLHLWLNGTFSLGYLDKPEALGFSPDASAAYLAEVMRLTGAARTAKHYGTAATPFDRLLAHEEAFVHAAATFAEALHDEANG